MTAHLVSPEVVEKTIAAFTRLDQRGDKRAMNKLAQRLQKEQPFLLQYAAAVRNDGFDGEVKVLTSCPSCLQGLSRFNDDAGTDADYIVVELAKRLLGNDWMADYVAKANRGGIERVIV